MAKNLVSELLPLLKDERHAIKKPAFQVLACKYGATFTSYLVWLTLYHQRCLYIIKTLYTIY